MECRSGNCIRLAILTSALHFCCLRPEVLAEVSHRPRPRAGFFPRVTDLSRADFEASALHARAPPLGLQVRSRARHRMAHSIPTFAASTPDIWMLLHDLAGLAAFLLHLKLS